MHTLCVLSFLLVATVTFSEAQRSRTIQFFNPGQQLGLRRGMAANQFQQPINMGTMNTIGGMQGIQGMQGMQSLQGLGGMSLIGGDFDGMPMLPAQNMIIPGGFQLSSPTATGGLSVGAGVRGGVGGRGMAGFGGAFGFAGDIDGIIPGLPASNMVVPGQASHLGGMRRVVPDGQYLTSSGMVANVDGSDVSLDGPM